MSRLIISKIQQILILGILLYPGMLLSATTDVWVESEKLVNTSPEGNDWFGYRVASNTDTLAIGCPRCDIDPAVDTNEGKVFLYKQELGVWKETQVLGLTGSAMLNAGFGSSLAINDQYLIIGAPYSGEGIGAVYIYIRQNGSWVPHTTASIELPASSAGHFGYSLALHKDTNSATTRLLVGSPGSTDTKLQVNGTVYLYEFDLDGTPGTPKEFTSDIVGDWFGFSLDIVQDNIIIGAPLQQVDGVNEAGNAYLYERNLGGSNNWGLKESLLPSTRTTSGNFGYEVKLENDLAVVSAFAANIDPSVNNNSGAGEVHVYRYNSTDDNWPRVKDLVPNQETTNKHFGASIDINNAKIAVAMLRSITNVTPSAGAIYLFEESVAGKNDWAEIAKLTALDGGGNDELGSSVTLSPKSLFAGAHEASNDNVGAVYAFSEISNAVPELTPPTNLNVLEDTSYSETVSVFDADSDPVTVTAQTLPPWLSFNSTSLTLSGTPTNDFVGDNYIEMMVSDGFSSTTVGFTINVTNVNDAPYVVSTDKVGAEQGLIYSYQIEIADPDVGDVPTIIPITIPEWAAFDSLSNTLAGTPDYSQTGAHAVKLLVDDGNAKANSVYTHEFEINVNNINDAPQFVSTPVVSVQQNTLYEYTIVVTDVDFADDNLIVSNETALPAWLTLVGNTLSGIPGNDDVRIVEITLLVDDGNGENNSITKQTFNLEVINVNDAPQFNSTPTLSVQQDVAYEYLITVSDVDALDDNLVITSETTLPLWLTLNGNTLSGTPGNDDVGLIEITLLVDDGNGAENSITRQTFELEVTNINDAPHFNFTPIKEAIEDQLYELTVIATDPDRDIMSVEISSGTAWLALTQVMSSTWALSGTPSNDNVGPNNIGLTVSDGNGGSNIFNFTITVINVNDAPTFTTTPVESVTQDQAYNYLVTIKDDDAGDSLILSASSIPGWLTLEGNILSGTPSNDDVGEYDIILTVDDGTTQVDQPFTLTVTDLLEGDIGFTRIEPVQTIEGDSNVYRLDVSRQNGSYGEVVIDLEQELEVDELADVTITPSTLTWTDGDADIKNVEIKIIDDTDIEGQESIVIYLSVANGIVDLNANSQLSIIIEDNDFQIIEPEVKPLDLLTLTLPKAMQGKTFNDSIQLNEGTQPYHFDWTANIPGLQFSGADISGTPTKAGDYTIAFRVSDSSDPVYEVNAVYTLSVKEELSIDVDRLNYAIADNDYSFQFKASGGDPVYAWKIDGELPSGLTLQPTGFLSGTPNEAGDHQINVVVEDESGFATQGQYEIKVLGFGLQNDTPVLPAARVGLEYHAPLLISGGSEPYVCEVVEGDLPGGIDMKACQISGTPAMPGDYDFVVGVVDLKNPALGRRDEFVLRVREPRALAIANATAVYNEIGQEDLSSTGPGKGHIDEVLTDMTTDAFGNHYVVGHAYNKGNYQVHLLKYAADKTLAWHQVFDSGIHDYIYSVAISPDQSVYIAGFQLEGNRYDGLIVKYSHKGVKEWERTYSGIDNTDNFYGLIASNDAVYVVGESYNGYDFDAIILKYSASGELQWTQKYLTSNNDTAYKIQLVSCDSEQEKDCETLLVAGTSGQEVKTGWLLSLNAHDGSYRADSLLFSEGLIKVLEQDRDGNVIVGGDRRDGGWLIAKVANDLNVLWNISYRENEVSGLRGIAVDPDGFIYVAGSTRINGNSDAFIGVLNHNGDVHQTFLLEAPDNEYPRSLVIDANLRLIVSGHKESKSGSKFLLWEVDYGGALQ